MPSPGETMMVGDLWLTRINEEGDDVAVVIDHADPLVLINDELLQWWRNGNTAPALTISGDVLTIKARNQTVVYRLTGERDSYGSWYAEWPD